MLNHPSSRIVLTGDILRPTSQGLASASAKDTLWLHRIFGALIEHVSAQAPVLVGWGIGSSPEHVLSDDDIAAIYAEHHAPLSLEGWVQLKGSPLPSPHLDALVKTHFAGATVISFELPALLEQALLRNGVEFVDIRLHPAGFLDDLLLAFRASAPHTQAKLAALSMPTQMIHLMANLAGAASVLSPSPQPRANSLLLLGQSDAPNARLSDFQEQVRSAAQAHEAIIVQAAEPHTLALLHAWGITAETSDMPLYGLLSHPHVSHVLALDADRASEARFFGKSAQALLPSHCPLAEPAGDPAGYHGIDDRVLTSAFWGEILDSPSPSSLAIPPQANRLRHTRECTDTRARNDTPDPSAKAHATEDNRQDLRLEELRLQQIASRSDMQVRLASIEHELHRAQASLATATRWQTDEMMYRKRSVLGRMVFRHNGRPTRSLRTLLFHASGKPRGLFRSWIINSAGEPRSWMRQWMMSPEYLAHPRAHHAPSLRPVLAAPRPFTAWRSVAGASDLGPEELDALMNAVRAEVQASQAPAHG